VGWEEDAVGGEEVSEWHKEACDTLAKTNWWYGR
jgi:hypothetical protein